MKKLFGFIAILSLVILLAACETATTLAPTTTTTTTTVAPVGAITWAGLTDAQIVRGDTVDLLEGVTATDSIDGALTVTVSDDDAFTSALAGGYVVTYTATNSTGVTETETKNFTVVIRHNVANGDFAIPSYGWNLDNPGGASTVSYVGGVATIDVTNAGNSWWGIQLNQQNMIFQEGVTYKLTFQAKSEEGRSLSAGFEDVNAGYAMLNPGFQPMVLTDEYQEYAVYYTADSDKTNIKVVVYLGWQMPGDEDAATIVIDDINVEIVTCANNVDFDGVQDVTVYSGAVDFDPLQGVTATDALDNDVTDEIDVISVLPTEVRAGSAYYVTYMVTLDDGSFSYYNRKVVIELAKDFEYQAVNGSFDNGLVGWTQDVNQTNGTGAATFTDNGDGTVSILVTNASDAGWHIQLQQASSTFREGETYVIRIVLKSDAARKVTIECVDPSNGFSQIAPTLNAVQIGTDWTTYEMHFTADHDYTNAKIGLLLGDVDGLTPDNITVTVDDFQVYKYDAYNEEFNSVVDPWNQDHVNAAIVDGEVVVTFVASGDGWVAGSDPWNNQLYQSHGSELVAGHTYQIDVSLKASVARTIRIWIEDVNKGYAAIDPRELSWADLQADPWTTISFTVTITPDTATTNAKFVVMFGDGGIAGVAHTVTIDFFRVTDITGQE